MVNTLFPNNSFIVQENSVYDDSTIFGGSCCFLSEDSEDTMTLGNVNTDNLIPPGALVTALAASLIVGTSPHFAFPDTWIFDRYITPNHPYLLGTNDIVFIYREFRDAQITPRPIPIVAATLTDIVGWGKDQVEFGLRDHKTDCDHRKTLTLPRSVTRLSKKQRLKGALFLFPSPSIPPLHPGPSRKPTSRGRRDSLLPEENRRGRIQRDSDDLPIWERR
ncbi:hypothetical protein P692DRAFT_20877961 [Suillus brevipes Sb2]|jgi:hypothetical protein|nr:hypothetical protein P692DRAFT_20877961 [Suillus brevipes Sb2]